MINNIYVATSWRNPTQATVVQALRLDGYEVYDFKNPTPGDHGFSWKEVGVPLPWKKSDYIEAVDHPTAQRGYRFDKDALDRADACVLVLPCGRSAHWELGYAHGKGKVTAVLLHEPIDDPELMICESYLSKDIDELLRVFRTLRYL